MIIPPTFSFINS